MKKCPQCAEEIQDDALKCKQCKKILTPETSKLKTKINAIIFIVVGVILLAGGVYTVKTYYLPNNNKNAVITKNNDITSMDSLTVASTTTTTPADEVKKENEKITVVVNNTDELMKQETNKNNHQSKFSAQEIEYGKQSLGIISQSILNVRELLVNCLLPREQVANKDILNEISEDLDVISKNYTKAENLTPSTDALLVIHKMVMDELGSYIYSSSLCLDILKTSNDTEWQNLKVLFYSAFSQGLQKDGEVREELKNYFGMVFNETTGEYIIPNL